MMRLVRHPEHKSCIRQQQAVLFACGDISYKPHSSHVNTDRGKVGPVWLLYLFDSHDLASSNTGHAFG
jgi:hypothetical protein